MNARLDQARCLFYHWGLTEQTSPFLSAGASEKFRKGMTTEDVVVIREKINAKVPIYNRLRLDSHTQAICGSQGCCLACVRHLEQKGLITKRMKQYTTEKDKTEKATITHKRIFLPSEQPPPGFIEKCKDEPDDTISTHVEGVG